MRPNGNIKTLVFPLQSKSHHALPTRDIFRSTSPACPGPIRVDRSRESRPQLPTPPFPRAPVLSEFQPATCQYLSGDRGSAGFSSRALACVRLAEGQEGKLITPFLFFYSPNSLICSNSNLVLTFYCAVSHLMRQVLLVYDSAVTIAYLVPSTPIVRDTLMHQGHFRTSEAPQWT